MTKIKELKEYYLNNKLIINCIILAVLFLVNCFWGNMAYIAYSVLALMIIFADTKEGFSLIVATIPFFCIKMSISMVLFAVCVVIYLVKAHIKMYVFDKIKPNKITLIIFVALLIYCLLPFGPYRVGYWVNFAATFILLGLINVFSVYVGSLRLRLNLNILAMSLLLATVYCLTYFISPYLRENLVTLGAGESFIRFAALFDNPLNLSRICEICVALQLYFILSKKTFTWVDGISMIIYVMLGLSTISKATLILFVIMAVILVVYLFKVSPFKTLLGLTIISLIVLICVFVLNDFIFTYMNRFIGADFDSLDLEEKINIVTTDRWDLWVDYVRFMFHNPLVLIFGAGLGAEMASTMNAHNFYITMVYELGFVGSALFVLTFVFFIKKLVKNYPGKISKAALVPLVILLLEMCVEDFFLCIY